MGTAYTFENIGKMTTLIKLIFKSIAHMRNTFVESVGKLLLYAYEPGTLSIWIYSLTVKYFIS